MGEYKNAGFQSPNHTQTPNDLFEMMGDMKETELKVTMAIIRLTFGYHRKKVRASLSTLQEMTGLSRQGVLTGAEAAVKRGTINKINDGGVTIWEMEVVNKIDQVVKNLDQTGQQIRPPSIKETTKEKDLVDGFIELSQMPGAKKSIRMDAIASQIGQRLHINPSSKKWDDFLRFVDDRQQKDGQDFERFLDWLIAQKNFDVSFWPPTKMMEHWPRAFAVSQKTYSEQLEDAGYV